uniref:Uncharacterized protein n=1 Tax=Octopus bimaculoides TaxID=37653 RepID=A0A0L8G8M1_OCTBM
MYICMYPQCIYVFYGTDNSNSSTILLYKLGRQHSNRQKRLLSHLLNRCLWPAITIILFFFLFLVSFFLSLFFAHWFSTFLDFFYGFNTLVSIFYSILFLFS